MYLVGHTALGVAAITALGITNPVAAFGVGWLSHYVADFFPHGDEPVGEWAKRGNEVRRMVAIFLIDTVFVFGAVAYFIAHRGWSWPAALAAFGSTVPDILWGLEMVVKRPFTKVLGRFHFRNHNFFHLHLPLWAGFAAQSAVAAGLWYWVSLPR